MTLVIPNQNSSLIDTQLFNSNVVPPEGPKGAGIVVPFSQAEDVQLNLLLTQATQNLTQVRAFFFDNSQSSSEVTLHTSAINQTVRLPPNSMGYLPLLCPKNAVIDFHSEGAVDMPLILLNVLVPAVIWTVPAGGNLLATAPAGATTVLGEDGGAVGDYIDYLLVVPASTSPGSVQIKDGSLAAVTVFAGGASSTSSLVPFVIPVGLASKTGPWEVIAGADALVQAFGQFT